MKYESTVKYQIKNLSVDNEVIIEQVIEFSADQRFLSTESNLNTRFLTDSVVNDLLLFEGKPLGTVVSIDDITSNLTNEYVLCIESNSELFKVKLTLELISEIPTPYDVTLICDGLCRYSTTSFEDALYHFAKDASYCESIEEKPQLSIQHINDVGDVVNTWNSEFPSTDISQMIILGLKVDFSHIPYYYSADALSNEQALVWLSALNDVITNISNDIYTRIEHMRAFLKLEYILSHPIENYVNKFCCNGEFCKRVSFLISYYRNQSYA